MHRHREFAAAIKGMSRLLGLVLLVGFVVAAPARADVITQWNEQVLALGGASRTLAMVQVAMFDAITAIQPRYRPYLDLPVPPAGALPDAGAAAAGQHERAELDSVCDDFGVAVPALWPAGAHIKAICGRLE